MWTCWSYYVFPEPCGEICGIYCSFEAEFPLSRFVVDSEPRHVQPMLGILSFRRPSSGFTWFDTIIRYHVLALVSAFAPLLHRFHGDGLCRFASLPFHDAPSGFSVHKYVFFRLIKSHDGFGTFVFEYVPCPFCLQLPKSTLYIETAVCNNFISMTHNRVQMLSTRAYNHSTKRHLAIARLFLTCSIFLPFAYPAIKSYHVQHTRRSHTLQRDRTPPS